MTTQTLDLGVADVHVDGVPKKTKTMAEISTKQRNKLPKESFADPATRAYPISDAAHVRNAAARLEQQKGSMSPAKYRQIRRNIAKAARKFGVDSQYNAPRKRKMTLTIDHPQHGRIEIRHMSDKAESSLPWHAIELDADVALAESDSPGKAVWIQLAIQGRFFKNGDFFELNDKVFSDIVRNFDGSENQSVPIDFEHATELPGSSGSIPMLGAPAQGWIRALDNRGHGGLWGLVEWGELARDYIRNKNYRFISPAIRFGCKDARTARDIGARLTSAGLTNTPFLDGMRPLAAKDTDGMSTKQSGAAPVTVTMRDGSTMAYSAHEYMPAIRAALKLPELATAEMCKEHFGMLRDHFDASGKDHTATPDGVRLADYMMPMRSFVQPPMGASWDDVLDIVEDLIESAMDQHMIEEHGATAPSGEAKMSDKIEVQLKDAETANAKLSLQLKDAESKVADLQANLTAKDAKIKALEDAETKRAEKADSDTVDNRFAVYKEPKKLTDDDKKAMLITLKADRALFDKLYPEIDPAKAYLMRDISTGPGAKPPVTSTVPNEIPDQKTLIAKFQSDHGNDAKYRGETELLLQDSISWAYAESQRLLSQRVA